MGLTDLAIRKLPVPETGQKTYWDKGFGVRVSQGGSKTFVLRHRGRQHVLGAYPSLSLKRARDAALKLKAGVVTQPKAISFSDALTAFLKDRAGRAKQTTVDGYWHRLKFISKSRLDRITPDDVPNTPQHRMAAKVFFNWCVRMEYIEKNPFAYVPIQWNRRDRVLSDDELKMIWEYEYPPYSNHLKFLVLTGCRKSESARFVRGEDTISIEGRFTKNGRSLTLPFTPMVGRLLPIPEFAGWSNGKARLDKEVPLPHWVLHDLRRTFATNHARLGTPIHVVEAMLNHSSGSVSGVAAIYIRHNFLAEARAAQQKYEEWLKSLVSV